MIEPIEQLGMWIAQGYYVQLRGQARPDGSRGWVVKLETLDSQGEMMKSPDKLALSLRTSVCATVPDAIEAAAAILRK